MVDEDRRRPAFCRVFWIVSSLVSSGSEMIGTEGGEMGAVGVAPWKELEFLRIPI